MKNNIKHLSIGKYLAGSSALNAIHRGYGTSSIPTTSVTNTGTVQTVVNDTNVYIPEMDIKFTGSLFKPNTRLYVFFDGKDVTSYVRPNWTGNENLGDPLYSDASGYIKGLFHVPNNSTIKFVAGKKELKFTDSSKNDSSETTHGTVYFTYSGSEDKTNSQDTGGSQISDVSVDPIVQSFIVNERGGMYLDSLNLYFQTKDVTNPVVLQIREIVEDVVSNTYLADSNVVITPDMIFADISGNTPTSVKLINPVFLQEGREYGIYLISNAPKTYGLAACVYGNTNTVNQLSTRDPRIGSLMKSLGSNVWLRDDTKGLKFDLYKCKFDTSRSYILSLENVDLGTRALTPNSVSTEAGFNRITIKDPKHGFNVGDFVTVSGLPANTLFGGINSNYINGIHRIDSITWNTYTFSTVINNNSEIDIPNTATESVSFGNSVVTDYSYQYDNILINNSQILLSDTSLNYTFKSLSGKSLDGSEVPNVFDAEYTEITNKVDYLLSKVKKISSPYNERNLNPGSAKSLQIQVQFQTSNENISPAIDKKNTNIAILENVINNQSADELTSDNGKGIARYITKDINLSEQSNGVQVRFYGNIQGTSEVKVYYKVLPVDSTAALSDQPWVEMDLDKAVQKSANNTIFNEYSYTVFTDNMFKAFKTKVLMLASDSTKPPLIRNYKAIAFQNIETVNDES